MKKFLVFMMILCLVTVSAFARSNYSRVIDIDDDSILDCVIIGDREGIVVMDGMSEK